jgi:AcrR family transcriptional regulator
MSTAPAPRWTRLERDERREQILTCARRLFSEQHVSAVSMTAIAEAAGVTRGLLNHYFGTKRDLYVEVVREMVRVPPPPLPEDVEGRDLRELWTESVTRWLEMVHRNRRTWLAALGAEGFGHDAEVEAVLDEAREEAARRIVAVLRLRGVDLPEPELIAVVRGYAGLAEATTREWLVRRRLTRQQVQTFLTESLLALVGGVAPLITKGTT